MYVYFFVFSEAFLFENERERDPSDEKKVALFYDIQSLSNFANKERTKKIISVFFKV